MRTITCEHYDVERDATIRTQLPATWVICGECDGEGKSSAHLGSFSMSDLREDQDFADDYFAGRYDRACQCCKGAGKVLVVDRERCLANPEHAAALLAHDSWIQAGIDNAAEAAAERRHMGYC
jgi:hypothetical protein